MTQKIGNVSDVAVQKATGKNWNQWIVILNDADADTWPHKEIAKWLHDQKLIASGWWCQCVTVGYEYSIGRRVLGETASTGFEVGVQRTFDIDASSAWDMLTSPGVLKVWLGNSEVEISEGKKFNIPNGIKGEIRKVKEGQRIRAKWQPKGWDNMTTLQMTLLPKGNKTSINFHQEKLENANQREEMKLHWQGVLEKLRESPKGLGGGTGSVN